MPALEEEKDCELWSREWELNLTNSDLSLLQGPIYCSEPECLLVVSLSLAAIPVTSFIVSGSIVVVGNTVHWIEEQGTCEDSMTQEAISALVESTEPAGGMIVHTGNEFASWVRQYSQPDSAQEHSQKDNL